MDINQLKSMTIIQLRALAKEKGVHSPTTLNKAQLIEKLAEKLSFEASSESSQVAFHKPQAPENAIPSYQTEDSPINNIQPAPSQYSNNFNAENNYQPRE